MVDSSRGRIPKKPPKYLLTIDPGAVTGWALFEDGILVACGYGRKEKILPVSLLGKRKRGLVVVEVPVIYPDHKQEKPPQDILRVGVLAGRYLGSYAAWGHETEEVVPKTWKGTISKPKRASQMYLITRRVLKLCTAEEAILLKKTKSARAKQLNHNVVDAVGMGFWWLEREI